MSRVIFGQPESVKHARPRELSDPLAYLRERQLGTEGARLADEAAMERMRAAARALPVVPVRRAKRARVNTIAPSSCTSGFRVVYHSLDAYVANITGDVRPDFMELLPDAQKEAKESELAELAPLPPFLGVNLTIRPYGGGTFAFLMGNADVTVKVRKRDHSQAMAAAQIELTAACLHRLGWRAALAALESWVAVWAPGSGLQPSEVDLCADTQGWAPTMGEFSGARDSWPFVCPVDKPTLIPYDGYAGYVRFGTGGRDGSRSGAAPIQFTIYDKSEEIRVHDKGWFVPLWGQNPAYRDGEMVTRIEARFRREWLKERGIETQAQLLANLDSLWAGALEWCRYCVPESGDRTRQRWQVREEWRVLRSLDWSGGDGSLLQRIDQARPRLERTLAAIGGHMVTLQALIGYALDYSLPDLAELAANAIQHRWESRGEDYDQKVADRRLRLGGLSLA
jgi:hypothetical protein